MYAEMPLLSGWTLHADVLPERLLVKEESAAFSLPGADALHAFSDLLGDAQPLPEDDATSEEEESGTPFTLPAMLPEDVTGRASLSREIDFAALCAQRAMLLIDHLCGSGTVSLDGETLASFGAGAPSMQLDLSAALRLGRKQTLTFAFDDARGAGVPGAVILRTTGASHFQHIFLAPNAGRTAIDASLRLHAHKSGWYAVRSACVPDHTDSASPWQESRFHLQTPGENHLSLAFAPYVGRFEAGKPYAAPAVKLELYELRSKDDRFGLLTDARTLMTGYPGRTPRAYIPLTKEECRLAPDELLARAKAARVDALLAPAPLSALFCRRCAQEGVALMQFPPESAPAFPSVYPAAPDALSFSSASAADAAASLCRMITSSPSVSSGMTQSELLADAAGKSVDPDAPDVQNTLSRLMPLAIRLRAEAARQGQYTGSICAPGEWQEASVTEALSSAFAPLHLSVLPMRGAWWTQSRFIASLYAFIPEDERCGTYSAEAELTDAQGSVLARCAQDCPPTGGAAGTLEALLPADPCVLTLRLCLKRSGAVAESYSLPVYVGLRGPLEAAF